MQQHYSRHHRNKTRLFPPALRGIWRGCAQGGGTIFHEDSFMEFRQLRLEEPFSSFHCREGFSAMYPWFDRAFSQQCAEHT